MIRPEQIDIHPLSDGAVTDDCAAGAPCQVTGCTYYGPETLVRLTLVGTELGEGAGSDAPIVTAKVFSHQAAPGRGTRRAGVRPGRRSTTPRRRAAPDRVARSRSGRSRVAVACLVATLAGGCARGVRERGRCPLHRPLQRPAPPAHRCARQRVREADRHPREVRTNDGVVLADQILQEGSHSPADVYLTENSPELMLLQRARAAGASCPLRTSPARSRPGQLADRGTGSGWPLRVSALTYDPALVKPGAPPDVSCSISAQPQWKGKVAIAPTDSDFLPLVGAVIATYGKAEAQQWLAGLKRNAEIYQDDEGVAAAVNRGDVATGIINQYYWYRLQLEVGKGAMHSALYYFPDHNVGSVENVSGAAVLASSAHRHEAEAFLRFLVSPAGQRIISNSDDFEYPARPGIAPNPALTPLGTISPATINVVALGNDQLAAQLVQQAGLV